MSYGPPPSRENRSVPGYLLVLAAFSVLMLLVAIAFGLVAFGIVDLGENEGARPTPIVGSDGPLQRSGFTALDSRENGIVREVDVNVAVTNTSDETISNATMLVQCLEGGNVSNAQLIVNIEPNQTLRFDLTLTGTGDPDCSSPDISFDIP